MSLLLLFAFSFFCWVARRYGLLNISSLLFCRRHWVSSAFSFLLLLIGSSLLRICQSSSNERLCLDGTGVILICQSCWYHYVRSFDPVRYFLLSFKICQYLAGKRMISTSKVDDTPDTDGWTHHTLVSLLSFISTTTQIPERSNAFITTNSMFVLSISVANVRVLLHSAHRQWQLTIETKWVPEQCPNDTCGDTGSFRLLWERSFQWGTELSRFVSQWFKILYMVVPSAFVYQTV